MATATQLARKHVQRQYRRQPRKVEGIRLAGAGWQQWFDTLLPSDRRAPMAQRHLDMWAWFDALTPGVSPPAKVDIWPRGGAKSSTVEMACAYVGTKRPKPARSFVLYVSGTQAKADVHVNTIATLLERVGIGRHVNKYGHSKGWTKQLLRADNGFNVMSFGLDAGMRGIKLDEFRPDLIVFDDIDEKHDTAETTRKKIETITTSVMPAGSSDCAMVFIQNKISPNGIAAKLIDNTADFLHDRLPVVVYPAIYDLEYEAYDKPGGGIGYRILRGTPSWAGQDVTTCEAQMNKWGLTAFLQEAQHEVDEPDGGMFAHVTFRRCRWDEVPWAGIIDTQVWCDPAVTNKETSDCNGIQADALHQNGTVYRLYSWEQRSSPLETLMRAILKAVELKASCVGVETDQGGDTWQSVYEQAWRALTDPDYQLTDETPGFVLTLRAAYAALVGGKTPRKPEFKQAKASTGYGGKAERWQRHLTRYEQGAFIHVEGTHLTLERALKRLPLFKPYDLADAAFWSDEGLRRTKAPAIGAPVGLQGLTQRSKWRDV